MAAECYYIKSVIMKTLIVLLVALVAITEAASDNEAESDDEAMSQEWNSFKEKFQKVYENDSEEELRKKVFMKNMRQINEHNSEYEKGLISYKLAVNKYADMSNDEFVRTMNGLKPELSEDNTKPVRAKFAASSSDELPDEVDWRDRGAVTDVKNQKWCGAGWAFSATGALEAQYFKKSGQLVPLSEQNLIDCSSNTKYHNNGCEGGEVTYAFHYIIDNNGIESENNYHYTGVKGKCHYEKKQSATSAYGFITITPGDEGELQQTVATVGPVSAGINSSPEGFVLYESGIFSPSRCSPTEIDHAVLVVGYGSENGKKYWLVKNSWGTTWGDKGYMKIARDQNNMCGIATRASYPLV